MRIILVGFGNVGRGLVEVLRDKAKELQTQHDFNTQVVGVITNSHGTLYNPEGLDSYNLLQAIRQGHLDQYPDGNGLQRDWDVRQMIQAGQADVLVEASPTNLETAQPALDTCYAAFEHKLHVVLANKGPVALAYHELVTAAQKAGRKLLFEATVMAGTPTLRLALEALAGCHVQEVRGILNGTTNYILTQMESGLHYAEALTRAQEMGYAEADPSADIDGWDTAGKALILAAVVFGKKLKLSDLDVKGIGGITTKNVEIAEREERRWKLVARVTPNGGSVYPMPVSMSDPLAGIRGATNAITFVTDLLGEITLIGPGAGSTQTAFGILSDLLDIHRKNRQIH